MKNLIKSIYNTLIILLFLTLGVMIMMVLTTIMFAILYEIENRSYFVSLIPIGVDLIAIYAIASFFINIYKYVSWN